GVQGHNVTSAANIYYESNYYSGSGVEAEPHVRFQRLPWSEVHGRQVWCDGEQVRKAALLLKHRRLVVLFGEDQLGKATIAREVIRRAAADHASLHELLQSEQPQATVSVSLEDWAHDADFRGRALVLKDAFVHDNVSLRIL